MEYELRIIDWSSDVCSSDLLVPRRRKTDLLLSRLAVQTGRQFRRRDHPADGHDPRAHVPDRAETVRLDGVDARAPAQDEGDPGALQGRQAAPAAGDHAALQEREGQSGRGLPADAAPGADLLCAVQGADADDRNAPSDRKSTRLNSSH